MSTCISSHGEYSSHTLGIGDDEFTCTYCGGFDQEACLAALAQVRKGQEQERCPCGRPDCRENEHLFWPRPDAPAPSDDASERDALARLVGATLWPTSSWDAEANWGDLRNEDRNELRAVADAILEAGYHRHA